MEFYHEVKEHMSPSALANWLGSRSSFIKSYFKNERGPETKAMAFGTKVHALIEGGMLQAKVGYHHNEDTLKAEVETGSGLYFLGKPDSYGKFMGHVRFVDYKSGKANGWDEKLPTDIKMMATAWLVWKVTGEPDDVIGSIEFIPTVWSDEEHDVVLLLGEDDEPVPSTVIERTYTKAELENFTKAILKAMRDVNTFYKKWQLASGEFVKDTDIEKALKLRKEIEKKEVELSEVEDRIASQMEFGGEENHKVDGGTWYFKETLGWEYPDELSVHWGNSYLTLGEVEPIMQGVKTAKKSYELVTEPATTKRSIAFRKPPEKKKHK